MAILIVQYNGSVAGAPLTGRVLIGRWRFNQVVVDHPDVSRIHAWITAPERQFCIADAGSRTGTFVNGNRVSGRVPLKHGDRITLGPAALTFHADTCLPAGMSALDFGPRASKTDETGVLFDCACGAPLWVPSSFRGKSGRCRFCGNVMDLTSRWRTARSGLPRATRRSQASSDSDAPRDRVAGTPRATVVAVSSETCGVCQSTVDVGEELATCPACGLTFHAGCWAENYGCSAFGCGQVDVLLPQNQLATTTADNNSGEAAAAEAGHTAAAAGGYEGPDAAAGREDVPREYLLLAGSVVGMLAGALTFGVPALLVLVAGLVCLRSDRMGVRQRRVALAAVLLAVAGMGAGVVISWVWWLGGWSGPG